MATFSVVGGEGITFDLTLLAFLFLVALGVDYNIFLMTRVREEARVHGTREGTLRALVATGGIIGPTLEGTDYSQPQLAVLAIAISAGSIIASHVNDGGFWIVAEYFHMTVKQTLQTWTVLETILSLAGFAMAAIMWAIL